MLIVRKVTLFMMALLLSSSAESRSELLVNSDTGEYVEVSCIFEYSCDHCTPRQGWDMTSNPGSILATGSESDYVIYGRMRDSWHCNFCGGCEGMLYNPTDRLCTISACDDLPEGWRAPSPGECHYLSGSSWVGPKSVQCADPCPSKTSCSDCVDQGCSWSWPKQSCRPTCEQWPCITDDRNGMCQEFEQQQAWNQDCEEKTTRDECTPSISSTPCRWVIGERCVGNFCDGGCSEAPPVTFLCDGLGVEGGKTCSTQGNSVQCSKNGKVEDFVCCCSNGEEDCIYVEGSEESVCALPHCDFSEYYFETQIPCTTQGASDQCVALDGSISDVTCCCLGGPLQTPSCHYRLVINESWCSIFSDVFPCSKLGDPCLTHSNLMICFNEDWVVVERSCCCNDPIGCVVEEVFDLDDCEFTKLATCASLSVHIGDSCSNHGTSLQCVGDENPFYSAIKDLTCCCGEGQEGCTYVEGSEESVCGIPHCDFNEYSVTPTTCTMKGDTERCIALDGSIMDVTCCCQGAPLETPICHYRAVINESWCSIFSDIFPCTSIGSIGDACSFHGNTNKCSDAVMMVVDRTCCCNNILGCVLEELSWTGDCAISQLVTCSSLGAGVGDSCSIQGTSLQCIDEFSDIADRTCCCNPGADCSYDEIGNESFCRSTEVFPCAAMGAGIGDSCSVHEQTVKCFDENTNIVERTCCCDPGQLECTFGASLGETSCISDKACFMETSELRGAVDMYLLDPSNPSSSVAQKYGYPMNEWCVSNIQDFSQLFNAHHDFDEDISGWDMAHAQDLSSMFQYCTSFNQPIGNWDTSNVETMELMFADCSNFNQDLPWDVSHTVHMGGMFLGCSSFNKLIDGWNVTSVGNMGFMFSHATNFNQSLERWDVSSVIDVGNLFYYATSFDQPLGKWNVANVENAVCMFDHATSFNQDVSAWETNFRWSNGMFNGAISFSQSLCAWSRHLPDDAFSGSMFVDTSCPYQEAEYPFAMDPMCMFCGHTCGDAGIGPGQQCAPISDQEICLQDGEVVDLVCCHLWDEYIKQGAICICFSGENVVKEANKGEIKMKDLTIGDMVEVGENQYDRVYSFGHYDPDGKGVYLQIHARDLAQPLEITANHLVFVLKNGAAVKPVQASQVKLGDQIVLTEGRPSEVTMITTVARAGFYAPFTESGKILVSGVLASNYAVSVGELETVKIAGIDFSMHWLAHAFTFPHRFLCSWNQELCQNETYGDNDQMPAWISGPRRFFVWVLDQNMVIRSLILIPFVVYCCIVSMEDYVLIRWTSLALACLFIILVNSGCSSTGAALSRMSLDNDDDELMAKDKK